MRDIHLSARAFGKERAYTTLDDIRVIVPLTSLMQVADAIIARKIQTFLDTKFGTIPGIMECARPRTQVLDISGGICLFIEKCLDLHWRLQSPS